MTHLLQSNKVQNKRHFIKIAFKRCGGTLSELCAEGSRLKSKTW